MNGPHMYRNAAVIRRQVIKAMTAEDKKTLVLWTLHGAMTILSVVVMLYWFI